MLQTGRCRLAICLPLFTVADIGLPWVYLGCFTAELRKGSFHFFAHDRRPTSRIKARTYHQGLPVDDDDGVEEDVYDPVLLAQPVVEMAVGPADPTKGVDVVRSRRKTTTRTQLSVDSDAGQAFEMPTYTTKGRKVKGESARFTAYTNQQPWNKIERAGNQHNAIHPKLGVGYHGDYDTGGVAARCILPLLRQLHAATPNKIPRAEKMMPLHQRELWTCGQNSYGELGHSDTGTRKVHCLVKAFEGAEIVDVAAGEWLV